MQAFAPYLDTLTDPQHRARMEEVLAWAMLTFPSLSPRIAWNQPMLTDHGTFIIGFSEAAKHMAVAPEALAMERFAYAIRQAGYTQTKQLIRFPWDRPVDYALLEQIIAFNMLDKADCDTFWRK